jgi:2-aminobenzoate-CoA ligase
MAARCEQHRRAVARDRRREVGRARPLEQHRPGADPERELSAGETLPAPTWHAWAKATGLKLMDGIGATEMLHILTIWRSSAR